MLIITDMQGTIDSQFGNIPFAYDSAAKRLKLQGLDPEQAMALLRQLDNGSTLTAPPKPTVATDLSAQDVTVATPKEKKKRAPRKTRVKKDAAPPEAEETKPGRRGRGTVDAPIEVKPEEDDGFDKPDEDVVAEEVDLADAEVSQENVPDGWERCMMDGELQVVHIECGATPCLCNIGKDEEEPEAMAAAEAEPAIDFVDASTAEDDTPEETGGNGASGDPMLAKLGDCERLLNVIPQMREFGLSDEQELFDKCVELKAHIPALARISANWEERIRRAIQVTTPA